MPRLAVEGSYLYYDPRAGSNVDCLRITVTGQEARVRFPCADPSLFGFLVHHVQLWKQNYVNPYSSFQTYASWATANPPPPDLSSDSGRDTFLNLRK